MSDLGLGAERVGFRAEGVGSGIWGELRALGFGVWG